MLYLVSKHIFTPKRKAIPVQTRRLIFERDLQRCRQCHRGEPDVQLYIDHIIPWSETQDNSPENLQLLCRGCNADKGAKLPGETVEDEAKRMAELQARIRSNEDYQRRFRDGVKDFAPRLKEIMESPQYRRRFEEGMAGIDRDSWRSSQQKTWCDPLRNEKIGRRGQLRGIPRRLADAFALELRAVQSVEESLGNALIRAAKRARPKRRGPSKRPRSAESRLNASVWMKAYWAQRKVVEGSK